MDHKVSKDMISSGMIPSGEKTQSDLGRTQYGSAPSPSKLMDAYKSMYEHHKKDADGNTIPHEGEDVKEMIERIAGMPPAKPKAPGPVKKDTSKVEAMKGQISDRKQEVAKTKDERREKVTKIMKDMGESVNLFDVIFSYYVEEGYDEKDIYRAMSSVDLTEDLVEGELNEFAFLPALAKVGGMLAKGGLAAGKAAAGKLASGATKLASAAGKGINSTLQGVSSAGKGISSTIGKGKDLVKTGIDKFNKMDSFQKFQTYQMGKDAVNTVKGGVNAARQGLSVQKKGTNTISADADLFDIVKGQLLDEGLSEEEIKDIMLILTPDEIMSEMAVNPNIAAMDAKNKADMIARSKAKEVPQDVKDASKRQYTAGGPKDKGENKYTTQDKKTIIDYNKNK